MLKRKETKKKTFRPNNILLASTHTLNGAVSTNACTIACSLKNPLANDHDEIFTEPGDATPFFNWHVPSAARYGYSRSVSRPPSAMMLSYANGGLPPLQPTKKKTKLRFFLKKRIKCYFYNSNQNNRPIVVVPNATMKHCLFPQPTKHFQSIEKKKNKNKFYKFIYSKNCIYFQHILTFSVTFIY